MKSVFSPMLGKRVVKVEEKELDELGDGETVNTVVRFTLEDGTSLVIATGCGDGPGYGTIGECFSFDDARKASGYDEESAKWLGKAKVTSLKGG